MQNPSEHPLNHAPLKWRQNRGLMERLCEHGVDHPEPDGLAYARRMSFGGTGQSTHGCDLCCVSGGLVAS